MNDLRRKKIEEAKELLSRVRELIEEAGNEEQEYYDNMPENMQQGDRGTKAEEAATALSDAEIESIESSLEETVQ